MEIKSFTVSEVIQHPDFNAVVEDYTAESGNPDLGPGMPAFDLYKQLESAGLFRVECAVDGDRLVGMVTVLVTVYPHFGKKVASVESLWLSKGYRKGPAGLKLIRRAQVMAKEMGAVGAYFGAREGSRLARLYERIFTPMNRLFWVKL